MRDFRGKIAVITGGGSLFPDERELWERTFTVCWNGA
jgi:hypothetical protein